MPEYLEEREIVATGTQLNRLSFNEGRVVEFILEDNGMFRVEEQCDSYFSVRLTADELRALGAEIIAAADMVSKAK